MITSLLCVQWLQFVPTWLTDRHTDIHTHGQHFDQLISTAQTAELKGANSLTHKLHAAIMNNQILLGLLHNKTA